MRRRLLIITIATLLVGAAGWLNAGRLAAVRGVSPQDRPLFSSQSELVVLHVTVKDSKGAYVNGLAKDAFAVLEDAQPQAIRVFTSQDAPVTVGILIDGSGSMQSNGDLVVAAASAFVETSNPQDEVFALVFNEDVRTALPPGTPFTNDASTLRDALTRTIAARGRTALYDAIAGGLAYVGKGSHERKVLVVVGDGGDNASRTATFEQVLASTQASNVVIYAVGLIDPVEREANPKRLAQLSQASGGEAFFPRDARQVLSVLQHVARDIRNSYTIGYVPASTAGIGVFHRIRVVVDAPGSRRPLTVRTRSGYLVAPRAGDSEAHAR